MFVILGVGALPAAASAAKYYEVLPLSELNRGQAHLRWHKFTVVEGTTTYHHVAQLTDAAKDLEINKTINTGTSPSTSNLTTLASWTADIGAPTQSRVGNALGVEIVGDYIQFPESQNDHVVRIHKDTGTVSIHTSAADIKAVTGLTSIAVTNFSGMSPDGESLFYESASNTILQTAGPGALTTLVTSADLAAVGATVKSGLTYDGAGNLYWGDDAGDHNTAPAGDRIFRRSPGGAIETILDANDFLALGITDNRATFGGDMYYGPDGLIYLRYGRTGEGSLGIYSFDPSLADPASSLAIVLSEADLISGPAGLNAANAGFTYHMSWWNGYLAFTKEPERGTQGYFALPEPASLLFIVLGALGLLRRSR
jgi:hypothetical protein